MGRAANKVQSHNTVRVDQHITAELPPIAPRSLQSTATNENQPEIMQHRSRTIDCPPPTTTHLITMVKRPVWVEKQGPGQLGLLKVGQRQRIGIERDNADFDVQSLKFIVLLPQLRQVLATR